MNEERRGFDGNKKQKLQCGRVARGEKTNGSSQLQMTCTTSQTRPFSSISKLSITATVQSKNTGYKNLQFAKSPLKYIFKTSPSNIKILRDYLQHFFLLGCSGTRFSTLCINSSSRTCNILKINAMKGLELSSLSEKYSLFFSCFT